MPITQQKLPLSLAFAFAVIVLTGCNQRPVSTVETKPAPNAGEIGSRLPDFSVKDFNGNRISSVDLRGKVVLVDIWATWCQPCKKEMPGYQKLLDLYRSRGFAVVGLKATVMTDTEDPVRFAQEVGAHYPLVTASATLTDQFGGIQGLPTTFIYDHSGTLRRKIIGFEYTNVIEAAIKPLLGVH